MNRITFVFISALIAIFICFFSSCPSDATDGGDQPTAEPTADGSTSSPSEDPTTDPTQDPTTDPTQDPTQEPTPGPTQAIVIINFEAAQQANIVFVSYPEPLPIAFTIYDTAGPSDDQCQLTFTYDTTNYWDGSAALKTDGKLITDRFGDDASHAVCQIFINLTGTADGTGLICPGFCTVDFSSKTVTGSVYVPSGSVINACSIILLNYGGDQTAHGSSAYANISEGWNEVSYGFDSLGKLTTINGNSVGPLNPDPAFNIHGVLGLQFRLAGPTSANGISGSANCTIDSISW